MDDNTKKKKYDAAYISYVNNGESAAVFIVRDVVNSIDTKGKWVDIIRTTGYKNNDDRWDFTEIIAEIFPRKITPNYPNNATQEDKDYITWATATEDITNQRENRYVGPKFRIVPKLVKKYKNNKPRWEYQIKSVERITSLPQKTSVSQKNNKTRFHESNESPDDIYRRNRTNSVKRLLSSNSLLSKQDRDYIVKCVEDTYGKSSQLFVLLEEKFGAETTKNIWNIIKSAY